MLRHRIGFVAAGKVHLEKLRICCALERCFRIADPGVSLAAAQSYRPGRSPASAVCRRHRRGWRACSRSRCRRRSASRCCEQRLARAGTSRTGRRRKPRRRLYAAHGGAAPVINPALDPTAGYDALRGFAPVAPLHVDSQRARGAPEGEGGEPRGVVRLAREAPGKLTYGSGGRGLGEPARGGAAQVPGRRSTSCTCPTRARRRR